MRSIQVWKKLAATGILIICTGLLSTGAIAADETAGSQDSVQTAAAEPNDALQVMPAETVSHNGLVSLMLPDESWEEVFNDYSAVCFSDGESMISVKIIRNGDRLPEVHCANDDYEMIYETVISNWDWVIITTGYVKEAADFAGIRDAMTNMSVVMELIPDIVSEEGKSEPEEKGGEKEQEEEERQEEQEEEENEEDPEEEHEQGPDHYVTIHDDEGEYARVYQIESGEWVDDNGRFYDYISGDDCWLSEDGYYFWE